MAKVLIPLLLKDVTGGARHAEVAGDTLGEIIAALDAVHPGIAGRIYNDGKLNPYLALTVDGKIAMQGQATPVGHESEVNILPAFGGG